MKAAPTFPAPVDWTDADAYAIRALQSGTANEGQQKRALDWIIRVAANTYDLSYRQGDADATAFSEGRRFVGLQIVKMLSPEVTAEINRRKKETTQAGDNA